MYEMLFVSLQLQTWRRCETRGSSQTEFVLTAVKQNLNRNSQRLHHVCYFTLYKNITLKVVAYFPRIYCCTSSF
jgi:hypothetical protein